MEDVDFFSGLIYGSLMLGSWFVYSLLRSQRTRENIAKQRVAFSAGLNEPASLHPVIDHARCIGCGSCVDACPEKKVLGLIYGKAELVNAAACIGHGACRDACPTGGITLVFGTETRGVDIPLVKPNFETNVPGIYIAGELGGMGLIKNAMTQGMQAVQGMTFKPETTALQYDLVIVGSGPAGIAAALTAKQQGVRYVVLEQESLGGAVFQYPRGKLVMTAPVNLPLVGKTHFTQTTKEELMAFFSEINSSQQLNIHHHERVEKIEGAANNSIVVTARNTYSCANILLAVGRRGTPRKLGVKGEDASKVVYCLIDPEQYHGQKVLVVGGGDSALEAACAIAEQGKSQVTLSYRRNAFSRVKQGNRDRVSDCEKNHGLQVMLNSEVQEIVSDAVTIDWQGETATLENDAIIVCAGGVLPTDFLKSVGIQVETKYGTA